jgi:hypothetical protein
MHFASVGLSNYLFCDNNFRIALCFLGSLSFFMFNDVVSSSDMILGFVLPCALDRVVNRLLI